MNWFTLNGATEGITCGLRPGLLQHGRADFDPDSIAWNLAGAGQVCVILIPMMVFYFLSQQCELAADRAAVEFTGS